LSNLLLCPAKPKSSSTFPQKISTIGAIAWESAEETRLDKRQQSAPVLIYIAAGLSRCWRRLWRRFQLLSGCGPYVTVHWLTRSVWVLSFGSWVATPIGKACRHQFHGIFHASPTVIFFDDEVSQSSIRESGQLSA